MQVTLERSNLLKSLNHVHRVVERRNTIPILSNVLLRADGGSLEMKATDLDLEINEATPAMVERGGPVPRGTIHLSKMRTTGLVRHPVARGGVRS